MKMKVAIVSMILLLVGVFVWAKTSANDDFAQAKDFPSGALVYLQVTDLPQVIKLWDESKLKEKYLASQNFADFQTSHLGIKLTERWSDLGNAIGFSLDLQTVSSLAEKQAAMAIYDVGKLDIVFVAPMNETLFSATIFAQNSLKFDENTLEDGTVFYEIEVEVDRQRQKQKIIFANIKNRFVLATSEKLFSQMISTINRKQRLYDEPNFNKLTEKMVPNLATVWINQEKLNADYYFKRYWLIKNLGDLQNIRAGIFDISLDKKGLTERREFLLKEVRNSGQISSVDAKSLLAKIPEDVPFYRLEKVDDKTIGKVGYDTLFDAEITPTKHRKASNNRSYSDFEDGFDEPRYSYDERDFDENINEIDEENDDEIEPFQTNRIQISGNPTAIVLMTKPELLENPLFAEFRKIAVISLQNPSAFYGKEFENSIVDALKNRVTAADAKFVWESANEVRKLKIPLLGWEIAYQLHDGKLFVSNSFELFDEVLQTQNQIEVQSSNLSDLTVVRLANREKDFNQIMQQISTDKTDFFVGNVSSLLDVIDDVKEVVVKRDSNSLYLHEEVLLKF